MLNINTTDDKTLISIFNNRMRSSESLWEKISNDYKKTIKVWNNKPDWLAKVPRKRSKVRDNRVFLAVESQLNKVTARPVKPVIVAANETQEAKTIATNIQKYLLQKYTQRNVKKTFKRGLRYLHFSKLMVLKPFWDKELDDFNVRVVDPRKVRFSTTANCEQESEFAIEIIDDKKILDVIEIFSDKETEILKAQGLTKQQALENNPSIIYHEVWIGDGVFWKFKNEVLKKIRNPYWDFQGLLLSPEEKAELSATDPSTKIPARNGLRRRDIFRKFKANQGDRRQEQEENKYETYLYNHFDKPRKPYIFGTIFEIEDSPVGEVSLIEIVEPLQEGVDKRKRQIADNADFLNGITKVDTQRVTMSLADARKIQYDPEGLVYGYGVMGGVTRETGAPLPSFVFSDMEHSIREIDSIFGTGQTFRGEGGGTETATGRAILRQESFSRLDEVISLVDYMGHELYNWWFQLIKVKYTESHFTKILGKQKAEETIELMQDELQEGIEIRVASGQSLPDDKIFRSERAKEDATAGIIDPVTYLEQSGGYDNPEETVKKAILFKINPLTAINFSDDELEKIQKANELLSQISAQGPQQGEQPQGDEQTAELAKTNERIQQFLQSDQFQGLPVRQQLQTIEQIRASLGQMGR